MKVLIADKYEEAGIAALGSIGCEVVCNPSLGAETLPGALREQGAEVLIVRSTKVPAQVFDASSSLRLVIRAGAGTDNIDSAAAGARGIPVCNCPGMNCVAVAELAMGLLLSCDRRIPEQTARLREGHWNKALYSRARGLKGLRLGIVGLGAIGRAVARRALAFEMVVVAWSRSLTPERASEVGVEFGGRDRAALLEMVGGCDAVTIHVSATPETESLCDDGFFEVMREGAYFINTSRGSVVDEEALARAIDARGIRVAVDVYRDQPSEKTAEWTWRHARHPQVAATTHHVGASTDQAQLAVAEEAARVVREFIATGSPPNCVNGAQLKDAPDSSVVTAGRRVGSHGGHA